MNKMVKALLIATVLSSNCWAYTEIMKIPTSHEERDACGMVYNLGLSRARFTKVEPVGENKWKVESLPIHWSTRKHHGDLSFNLPEFEAPDADTAISGANAIPGNQFSYLSGISANSEIKHGFYHLHCTYKLNGVSNQQGTTTLKAESTMPIMTE